MSQTTLNRPKWPEICSKWNRIGYCSSLSKNALDKIPRVTTISCDIFFLWYLQPTMPLSYGQYRSCRRQSTIHRCPLLLSMFVLHAYAIPESPFFYWYPLVTGALSSNHNSHLLASTSLINSCHLLWSWAFQFMSSSTHSTSDLVIYGHWLISFRNLHSKLMTSSNFHLEFERGYSNILGCHYNYVDRRFVESYELPWFLGLSF